MKEKIESLQGLRGIAFIFVFLSHAIWQCGELGYLGVSIFFVLSGFLMTVSYYAREINASLVKNIIFAAKKISKLYPLHIFTMLPFILLAVIGGTCLSTIIVETIVNIFLLQAWIPIRELYTCLNGVAWYLSATVFLYFCFPYIIKHIRSIKNIRAAVVEAVLVFLFQVGLLLFVAGIGGEQTRIYDWISYVCPVFRLGDFLIGCLFGFIFLKRKNEISKHSKLKYVSVEVILAVLLLISFFLSASDYSNIIIEVLTTSSIIYLPISVWLVYMLATDRSICFGKVCKSAIFVKLGNISPYGFLIHMVILSYTEICVDKFIRIPISPIFMVGVEFIITVVVSVIYMRVESIVKANFTR